MLKIAAAIHYNFLIISSFCELASTSLPIYPQVFEQTTWWKITCFCWWQGSWPESGWCNRISLCQPRNGLQEVLINGKQRVDLPLTPLVYVTKDEREEASHLKNMKKADLDKRIESLYPNYQMNQQSYFIRNSYITSKRSWHPPRKKSLLPPVNRLSSQQNYLMYRIRKIQKQMNDFHKFSLLFIFNSEQ